MKIILGLDPSTVCTGYSVIRIDKGKADLLDCGCIKMPSKKTITERVGMFYDFLTSKIKEWDVSIIATETPFMGKSVTTYGKLSYLRGILHLLACQNKLPLHELTPREVKCGVTGYGGSSKEQVANMVAKFFPQLEKNLKDDITDAIAVGLCAMWYK